MMLFQSKMGYCKTQDRRYIGSCKKTGYMKAFKDIAKQTAVGVNTEEEGWLWWVHEYEKRFVEMITEGLDCKVIYP